MATTVEKLITDVKTVYDDSSVDVLKVGVTQLGQPEFDIGQASLVNSGSNVLQLNGQDLLMATAPVEDGAYVLEANVESGATVYNWSKDGIKSGIARLS